MLDAKGKYQEESEKRRVAKGLIAGELMGTVKTHGKRCRKPDRQATRAVVGVCALSGADVPDAV